MKITKFRNDALGFDSFEGYTKGEYWNGWACPYFTFKQAQQVMKTHNELREIIAYGRQAYYEAEEDAFVFPLPDDEDVEIYTPVLEEGQKFYQIGSICWIWEEAD